MNLSDSRTVTVTHKHTAINLFDHSQNNLWTYDLEGRLVGMYVDQVSIRRTLDNRFFNKTRDRIGKDVFRKVVPVSISVADKTLHRGISLAKQVAPHLDPDFQSLLSRIQAFDMDALEREASLFRDAYLPISILPPDQYRALVLQITEGCNFNQCLFCNFYRDRPFRIKNGNELETHIQAVQRFFRRGLSYRKSIFLADANALVVPQKRLLEALETIRAAFPGLPDIYSFIDVFTGLKKSKDDFKDLAAQGVRRVYLGVESGNPDLLEFLKKPQVSQDIVQLSIALKGGGIDLGIILLAGAGGTDYHRNHRDDSVDLIRQLPLDGHDIIYISEFYETNQEYRQAMETHGHRVPKLQEIRFMARDLKQALRKTVPEDVTLSVYDIQQFFY